MDKKYYDGYEILNMYDNIQNNEFKEGRFILIEINKEFLYDKICCNGNDVNLISYDDWNNDEDNYDNWHTDNINNMIEYINEGNTLPPLIVNRNYGLYDGQHRLTAYSMIDSVDHIKIFKQI